MAHVSTTITQTIAPFEEDTIALSDKVRTIQAITAKRLNSRMLELKLDKRTHKQMGLRSALSAVLTRFDKIKIEVSRFPSKLISIGLLTSIASGLGILIFTQASEPRLCAAVKVPCYVLLLFAMLLPLKMVICARVPATTVAKEVITLDYQPYLAVSIPLITSWRSPTSMECPFETCHIGTRRSTSLFRDAETWYHHLISHHETHEGIEVHVSRKSPSLQANALGGSSSGPQEPLNSAPSLISEAFSSKISPQQLAVLPPAASPISAAPTTPDALKQPTPPAAVHGTRIDLCFYPRSEGDHHDWLDTSYIRDWTDRELFLQLGLLYRAQRTGNASHCLPTCMSMFWSRIRSVLSFTLLSSVRLASFTLVPDLRTSTLKASCTEYRITQGHRLEPFRSRQTQAFLAKAIRSAHKLNSPDIPHSAYNHYYFTQLVACIARESTPSLGLDARGTGIEFVEKWDDRKFSIQLVAVLLLSVFAAIGAGVNSGSQVGFTVFGTMVAVSQLIVATVALLLPAPGPEA